MAIYSLEVEKLVLAGLIKFPKVYADVAPFVSEHDFFNDVHNTIFCVLRQFLTSGSEPDKILIGQTIKNMNISFTDDINIFDYLDALSMIQLNIGAVVGACKELKKFTIARQLEQTGIELAQKMKSSLDLSAKDIIATADKIYNDRVSIYEADEQPRNLFENMEAMIEERGNNPVEETGLKTPYPEFNNMFGGLKPGNLYTWVSRPGAGKSSFLGDIIFKTANICNKNIPSLILDTEMEHEDIVLRAASSLSQVPMWFLETGNWRRDEEMVKRVRAIWPLVKNFKVEHLHVSGKPIDQIASIMRRWYYSKVGRGNPGIVAYDYVKLTGEKSSEGMKEYQIIGEKVDMLKQLSVELQLPILVACQMNRSAEGKNSVDDSSAIAQSDRLQWFATFVGIFRRKTLEEIASDGESFGTHKMIPLKSRFQGRASAGHHDLVRITHTNKDGEEEVKYVNNYLNFNVNNFNVEERGSLRSMLAMGSKQFNIDTKVPEGELL